MTLTKSEGDQWIIKYQQGELEFDELFKKFEKLIHDCFWRFLKKHQWECPTLESEDLKSVCYLAFYKSAKGFDIRKGYSFSTYFYKTAYFSMLYEYQKHLGERPLSLEWEEEKQNNLLNTIGVDGFSEARRLEWLEYMKEVMERKKFEPNMVEAILIHLETREPLYKVAPRYGIYQVKASRYLTKLKKELRVAG